MAQEGHPEALFDVVYADWERHHVALRFSPKLHSFLRSTSTVYYFIRIQAGGSITLSKIKIGLGVQQEYHRFLFQLYLLRG